MAVPLFATTLNPQVPEIVERLQQVAASGRYVLGPEVEAFEREFAEYCGARHCVGVANGTDAITIALRALGVRPGDDVVVPSFTFYASAEAVVNAGATPVFCDVDPETFCVTRESVEAALTSRTRAVMPVHLFGRLAPDLGDLGVPVLADAAQAAGAARAGDGIGALQPSFGRGDLDLPGTRAAAATNVALPMGPGLTEQQVDEVIAACVSGST